MRLLRDSRLSPQVAEAEFQADRELLASLSLDYHQTLKFICQWQPDFHEFEDWASEQGSSSQQHRQNSKDRICKKLTIPDGLYLRPSTAADKPFLEKLHHSTRQDLQFIDGEQDFIESIVEMQFKAQTPGIW